MRRARNLFPSFLPAGLAFMALFLASAAVPAIAQTEPQAAEKLPLAVESLLLDAIRVGDRWVAVGERGHVILSDDGQSWRQANNVPVRSTLTGIASQDSQLFAVGHDQTILKSSDQGENWEIVRYVPGLDPMNDIYDNSLPFLDIGFTAGGKGYAIGAYGLLMQTTNGGTTWELQDLNDSVTGELFDPESFLVVDEDDYASQFADLGCYEFKECHLNSLIYLGGGRIVMVAEKGFGYRSNDSGDSWEVFRLPYEGSMFGIIQTGPDCVLAFGLRGNAFESCDFAESWNPLSINAELTLAGGAASGSNLLLAGSGASIILRGANGQIEETRHSSGVDFAEALPVGDGSFILIGEEGIHHYPESNQ